VKEEEILSSISDVPDDAPAQTLDHQDNSHAESSLMDVDVLPTPMASTSHLQELDGLSVPVPPLSPAPLPLASGHPEGLADGAVLADAEVLEDIRFTDQIHKVAFELRINGDTSHVPPVDATKAEDGYEPELHASNGVPNGIPPDGGTDAVMDEPAPAKDEAPALEQQFPPSDKYECRLILSGHALSISALKFSPDGSMLASSCQ
jgi:hypothetical protein